MANRSASSTAATTGTPIRPIARTPSLATILFSVKNPDRGGDTEFSNQYAAYEALSDELKTKLAGLKGIHAVSKLRNKRVTVSPRRPDAQETYETPACNS